MMYSTCEYETQSSDLPSRFILYFWYGSIGRGCMGCNVMASKIALRFLRDNGIDVRHNQVERGNFATGTGLRRFSLPYHIVAVDSRNGTAKRTVGWYATQTVALRERDKLNGIQQQKKYDGETETGRGGAEYHDNTATYYVMDIRTNETVFKKRRRLYS